MKDSCYEIFDINVAILSSNYDSFPSLLQGWISEQCCIYAAFSLIIF